MIYMKGLKNGFLMLLMLLTTAICGCYKKDIDEFKNSEYQAENDLALSLFNVNFEVRDSLSFVSAKQYSGETFIANKIGKINDSVSFKLNGYTIKEAELKILVQNNFPVDVYLQGYFLDDNNQPTDSLFTLTKYKVTAAGNTYTVDEIYLKMDPDKFKRIVNCRQVKLVYNLATNVSHNDNYSVTVGCGVIVKASKAIK